jgi:hypothetical protein
MTSKDKLHAAGRGWSRLSLQPVGRLLALLVVLFLLGGGLVAYAQTGGGYDLTWWTVDGGGETGISGGNYTLLSTAGQPDARAAIGGGDYILLSGFWPGEKLAVITRSLYLPFVLKSYQPLPDLVGSFGLTPDKASFSAGEPVLITAIVTNLGPAPAGPFWVDFYINPSRVPGVNDPWNEVCGMSPCYGIAWYVSGGLAPGQSVSLTSTPGSYASDYSIWPGYYASGTSDLYLYVDSWNRPATAGGVLESDETNNMAERHGAGTGGRGWRPFAVSGQPTTPPGAPGPVAWYINCLTGQSQEVSL